MTAYRLTPPEPSAAQLAEIAKLEASAIRSREMAEESFQRCDTDGFLSQWAHGIGAQKDAAQIAVLKNGGYVATRVLCNAANEIVSDEVRWFAHPVAHWTSVCKWDLGRGSFDRIGRRYVPMGAKSRVQKQLGLHEEIRWVPGYAKVTAPAGQRGLGGCASAYIGRFRSDTDMETV